MEEPEISPIFQLPHLVKRECWVPHPVHHQEL